MGKVAVIKTAIEADSKQFRKETKAARKAAKKLKKDLKALGGRAFKVGGVLSAVALGALVLWTKKSLDSIDATSKLSDELGIQTEALAAYNLQAGLSGTSQATLTKGLQRLTRVIGETKQGFGAGAKGLEMIGIAADDLEGQSVEDTFARIADGISEIEDPTKRAAAAYAIFGRQGQEIMNFLMMGSKGMRDAKKDAERLGLAFSRVDGARVEEANDAMLRAGSYATGLGNIFAIELSPFITEAAEQMGLFVEESGGIEELAKGGFNDLLEIVRDLTDAFNTLRAAQNVGSYMMRKGMAYGLDVLDAVTLGQQSKVGSAADGLHEAADIDYKEAQDQWWSVGDDSQGLRGVISNGKRRARRERDDAKAAEQAIETAKLEKQSAEVTKEKMVEYEKLVKEAEKITASVRTAAEITKDEIKELNKLYEAGVIDDEVFNRKIKMIHDGANAEWIEQIKQADKEAEDLFNNTRTNAEKYKAELDKLKSMFSSRDVKGGKDTYQRGVEQLRDRYGMDDAKNEALEKAIEDQKKAVEAQAKVLRDAKAIEDTFKNAAKSIFESTRTPLEEFRAEMEKLKELKEDGFFTDALGGLDTFERQVKKIRDDLIKETGQDEFGNNVKEIEKSFSAQGSFSTQAIQIMQGETRAIEKENLDELKKVNKNLIKVTDAVKDIEIADSDVEFSDE